MNDDIFLSERNSDGGNIDVYQMKEVDLMFSLLCDCNNPVTNNSLSEYNVKKLSDKYSDVLLVCGEAQKLGYKHQI